ncbi:SLBB domain-containing protein [Pedobacter duraquae]|uniref:Protein involved in polysaccharide export with SLBB domain n=1 Tax=Pedobacter duraquae TaxID=425511 RepID=A0A4R6ID25_9SPHI|nr:SLBB domain-containing protein [Pedobacter duraquae]TDO20163.1 protein involved in polysaccharide export with SLBB domain [Pedobacter duraquae]
MRFKIILFILFTGLTLINFRGSAQTISTDNISKVKVDQLSDQQILAIWAKFEASGLSEDAAMKMLIDRGLDPTEADKFKKRLSEVQAGGKGKSDATVSIKKPELKVGRDTTPVVSPKPVIKPSKIYGSDFFSNPNLKFEPNLRLATPKGYVLGPDDEVVVLLNGLNETSVTAKISPDGNLKIPNAGLVYLNGYTIEQATNLIKQKMQKVYPALASGQTKLTVNLGSVRSIRVTVIGEAMQPGTYTLSSLSTLFNALYLSGGPAPGGSLRNIEVIRGNRVIKTVDFYTFLQRGVLEGNVSLQDQDVIRIPVYTKRVAIDGQVKRPGLYELKNAETLSDLITYTGGFSDLAYRDIAKVTQITNKERSVKDIPADLFDRFVLRNADSVYFGAVLSRFANRVVIEGAVYRPGTFELTPNTTLKSLIAKADGLRDDASLNQGYIKRISPNLDKLMIPFDLSKLLSGSNDIPLLREDSVMIFSVQDLKDESSITMGGFVRMPGNFTYRKGMTVGDAVAMAGGFTNDAASHRLEISRLVKNTSDVVSNQLLTIITVNLDSALSSSAGDLPLEPLDYLYVPRLVNYRTLGSVRIRGEVLFPGDYPVQRRDETGNEFIIRAGGITPVGSLANAKIYRNGTRVDIDLTGQDKRQVKSSMIFMAGDSVYIPRETPFVEVVGAVNNPQLLNYVSRSFKYYTNAAGGTKENARLKGAYVQYANGTNQPVKHFLFFRNYPTVTPGSKIVVPEKTFKLKLGVGEISAITSAIGALVTLIAILVK